MLGAGAKTRNPLTKRLVSRKQLQTTLNDDYQSRQLQRLQNLSPVALLHRARGPMRYKIRDFSRPTFSFSSDFTRVQQLQECIQSHHQSTELGQPVNTSKVRLTEKELPLCCRRHGPGCYQKRFHSCKLLFINPR